VAGEDAVPRTRAEAGGKALHGLRKLAAIESARGSHEAAAAAITRATGVQIGKRQAEELARRC
jgi:hypothetical protein